MNTNVDYIEIKDLVLASYLYSTNQVQLSGKRKLINGEIYFRFAPKETAELLILQYWNLQAPPVQPKALFAAYRDLKDMIFGG